MLVGWMVVYLISYVPQLQDNIRNLVLTFRDSYPIYSFLLPVYSFWCMDDFGWGNTRLVIGEGTSKKVMINDDEKFDESMIPLKKFSGMAFYLWKIQQSHVVLQSTKQKLGKLARVIQKRVIALG
jgi:chitin synthase